MSSPRIRLLSLTMLVAFLLLGVKVGDLMRGGSQLSKTLFTQATAQDQATPPPEEAVKTPAPMPANDSIAPKPAEAPAAAAPAAPAASTTPAAPAAEAAKPEAAPTETPPPAVQMKTETVGEKPAAEGEKKPEAAAATTEAKPEEKPAGTTEGKTEAKPEDATNTTESLATPAKMVAKKDFSQVELDLLQSLSKRREELDKWAKTVEMKEAMLGATEQNINDKIAQMRKLQKDLEVLLVEYNSHEDAKIRSLVKIYENMKPGDAARIFDELEMSILLEVADKMSERKAAPILAKMNPDKARDLTIELAEQRRLQKPTIDAVSASQAPAGSDTNPASPAGTTNN